MASWVSKRGNANNSTPKKPVVRDIQDTPDLEKYLAPPSKSNSGPSKSLFCGICADVFKRPMRAPCGHSFCQRCITTWLSMNNKTCPQDRRPLTVANLHHDFIIESLIAELPAVCPFKSQGCPLGTRPLPEIRQHAAKCDFNPDNIPDFIRAVMPTGNENLEIAIDDYVESPVVISDDESSPLRGRPAQQTTPVATNSRRVVIDSSPEEPAPASSAALPLRLRLLRTGVASVDQLRDVVGAGNS